jgi:hypothetical protein
MRKKRVPLGLEHGHTEDDIAHIISKIRYMLRLAKRKEQIDAQATNNPATDDGTTTD